MTYFMYNVDRYLVACNLKNLGRMDSKKYKIIGIYCPSETNVRKNHSSVVCIQIAFSCCFNDVFDLITNLTFLMRRDTFLRHKFLIKNKMNRKICINSCNNYNLRCFNIIILAIYFILFRYFSEKKIFIFLSLKTSL